MFFCFRREFAARFIPLGLAFCFFPFSNKQPALLRSARSGAGEAAQRGVLEDAAEDAAAEEFSWKLRVVLLEYILVVSTTGHP